VDLRRALAAMPRCIGEHDPGHAVCDGVGRPPCAHRDICVAIQLRAKHKGLKRTSYIQLTEDAHGRTYAEPRDTPKLMRIVSSTIERYGVREGIATRAPGPSPGPVKPVAPAAKAVARRPAPEQPKRYANARMLDAWFKEWLGIVSEATGLPIARLEPEARPGELYFKDRRAISCYCGVYIKAPRGQRDVPVAAIHWRARLVRMDIKFPFRPGEFVGVGRERMRWLRPQEHKDGAWLSWSRGLDRAAIRMSAEVVASLITSGRIKVPEV
jgi:hypothetical protein